MIGLGCMRLSTDAARDDARSRAVLDEALDAGITLLDTADAYARDDLDRGHNEQLIAQAIAGRPNVEIVTKGGLVRPEGAWVPDGRARHLDAAARASRERLGVPAIDLYLLHAVDPRVALATSVRALAKLRDAGVVRAIGLSNINQHQLEQALQITSIDAIEIELGPHKLDALRSGLVPACLERGIRVLAHRPLGGPAGLKRLARQNVAPEVVLAWLASKGVVPLPGATRIETARSIGRANQLALDADTRDALDRMFLEIAPDAARTGAEVTIVMGMPGAGKTTLARQLTADGHVRLNRDERGGTLAELSRALDRELAAGATKVVLDNTYGTRASRATIIAVARRRGAAVRCVVIGASLEQAQHNAVVRMLAEHGRLLDPGELVTTKMIGPGAQFRYRRTYEPPTTEEGFVSVEETAFERRPRVGLRTALIVELDGLVWRGRPRRPEDVELVGDVRDRLARWHAAGHLLAGTTWQTSPAADARLVELLGLPLAVLRCTHPAGPPVCWCRKPMPGLALAFAHAHDVDLARSTHVGHGPADRGFALRAGIDYVDAGDGWPAPA